MTSSNSKYQPSAWTFIAAGVAMIGLLAWGVAMRQGLWWSEAFGMIIGFFLHGVSRLCALLVLLFSMIGMIRRDPLAFVVLTVTAGLAILLFMLRDPNFDV